MRPEDPSTIGMTIAEINALQPQASSDDFNPETDWDPLVQAAKIRQAASDAAFAKDPTVPIAAADGLAVVIARLQVGLRKAGAH